MLNVLHGVIAAALLLALWRLVRGPRLADRVVALDLLASIAVGFLVLRAIATGLPLYLDIALGIGLISVVGTIACGAFIEHRAAEAGAGEPRDEPPPEARP